MIDECERYDELKHLALCVEEFKIDVKCYEDLDCFVEHDMAIVRRILDDADTALNMLISVINKDVRNCQCGQVPRLNTNVMKIECPWCGMSGPRKASRAEAVEAWNRIVKGLEGGEE